MALVDEYKAEMQILEQRHADALALAHRTGSAEDYRRAALLSGMLNDMAYAVGEMVRGGRIYARRKESRKRDAS
jgi:hypothetical protein